MQQVLPKTIGRYDLRRELGRGAMGVVYEAVDRDSGRVVALKIIHLGFVLSSRDQELFEQRFLAEARIASRLSHPGIVAVHEAGRDAPTGTLYIALEYVEGRTLAEIIKAGSLPWREALRVTAGVARALHHAHVRGVVHRDVKPENIAILRSGEPKLMDFGIAKTDTARIKLTATGQFFGTPLFMAPEQALGRTVDARADLFSLGCVLYSLLAGRNAFGAENITKIITRVVQHDPPPPSHLVPDLPVHVDYVVARALAKDPADRYPDGESLAEDIEDVLAGRHPRHQAGWNQPRARTPLVPVGDVQEASLDVERFLVEPHRPSAEGEPPAVDIEAQLADLVAPHGAGNNALGGLEQAPTTTPKGAAQALRVWLRHVRRRAELRIIALFVVVLIAGLVMMLPRAGGKQGPVGAARLAIELESSVKSGQLRIWVDRRLVVRQRFDVAAGTITAFDFGKGHAQEFLELPPGGHDVEVLVAWDGTEKVERIRGDFKAGSTRRLRARIAGLFKGLSLEWQ